MAEYRQEFSSVSYMNQAAEHPNGADAPDVLRSQGRQGARLIRKR
jgi:hypothetical protein